MRFVVFHDHVQLRARSDFTFEFKAAITITVRLAAKIPCATRARQFGNML